MFNETISGLWWGSNPRPPHYESDVQPAAPYNSTLSMMHTSCTSSLWTPCFLFVFALPTGYILGYTNCFHFHILQYILLLCQRIDLYVFACWQHTLINDALHVLHVPHGVLSMLYIHIHTNISGSMYMYIQHKQKTLS